MIIFWGEIELFKKLKRRGMEGKLGKHKWAGEKESA